jgi:hypothetical protein
MRNPDNTRLSDVRLHNVQNNADVPDLEPRQRERRLPLAKDMPKGDLVDPETLNYTNINSSLLYTITFQPLNKVYAHPQRRYVTNGHPAKAMRKYSAAFPSSASGG